MDYLARTAPQWLQTNRISERIRDLAARGDKVKTHYWVLRVAEASVGFIRHT